jgi:paraquat-inducible protein B
MTEPPPPPTPLAEAVLHQRPRFQLIWLIPAVALLVAGYLAWDTIRSRGPMITLSFPTADGLQAGQTKVRHKAVELGTVQSITLSDDLSHVNVRVQMRREAIPELTDKARFWVVRPRLSGGNVSGLDTLLSGAFIELDPGSPEQMAEGQPRRAFEGLDDPPAVRSDEPGTTYVLQASRIGGITTGSPVLYRDEVVGEVLRWAFGPQGQGFFITIFVRKPYDSFIHEASQFWNGSGVTLDLGADGISVRLGSLQALLTGAVAFDTDGDARTTPVSKPGATFHMYRNQPGAAAAGYKRRLTFATRFRGSVRGLALGAAVEMYGITIGTVTGVKLQFDPAGKDSFVEVRFEIQPERILAASEIDSENPLDVTRNMVHRGLRMTLHTVSYLTSQLVLSMDFVPDAEPAEVSTLADGTVLLPSQASGLEGLTAGASQVIQKLSQVPFDKIGRDLDTLLSSAATIANGPELRRSIATLSATLVQVQDLVRKVDTAASPALKDLPAIADNLNTALARTAKLVASADAAYGSNSGVLRDVERLLAQFSDAARSVRLLADYLAQHPESLIQGRTGRGVER